MMIMSEFNEPENNNNKETEPEAAEDSWQPRDMLIAVIAFIVIVVIAVAGYFIYQEVKTPPLVEGDPAPEFTLPVMGGGEVSLSDYRGQVVLINIWATWCDPCREEMPFMEQQYQRMKELPFEILAVSTDRRGEVDVRPFVEEYGLTFPILLDTDKDVADAFQSSKYPESFIIDKDGIIVRRIVGQLGSQDFQLIEHLAGR